MMKMIKHKQTRYIIQITALTAFVVGVGGTAAGLLVTRAVKLYLVPDTTIVSIYLICLLALWQYVAWITPRGRSR